MSQEGSTVGLFEGMTRSGLSYDDLWLRHIAVSGTTGKLELEAYVLGLLVPDAHQHNLIAQAINEYFMDIGDDHPVGYRDPASKL